MKRLTTRLSIFLNHRTFLFVFAVAPVFFNALLGHAADRKGALDFVGPARFSNFAAAIFHSLKQVGHMRDFDSDFPFDP